METDNKDYSCETANLNAPTMFGSKDLSKDLLAKQLRDLMPHVNDDDRCTLCKAAEALESRDTNLSWPFVIIFYASRLVGVEIPSLQSSLSL